MSSELYNSLKQCWKKGYKIPKIKENISELARSTDDEICTLFGYVLNKEFINE